MRNDFYTTYLDFLNQYLLVEDIQDAVRNPLDTIPKEQLGMSTSIKALPENVPYGFWVDTHGNFVVCPTFATHRGEASRIVQKAKRILPMEIHSMFNVNPYVVLFNNGFIRVVSTFNRIEFEKMGNTPPTSSQMKFLRYIKNLYNLEEIYQDKANEY